MKQSARRLDCLSWSNVEVISTTEGSVGRQLRRNYVREVGYWLYNTRPITLAPLGALQAVSVRGFLEQFLTN